MESTKKFSYYFNILETKDNVISEVMNFDFGGHHDLAALYEAAKKLGMSNDKHAKELVLGVRLMHHVLKKYPNIAVLADFFPAFEDFKKKFEAAIEA